MILFIPVFGFLSTSNTLTSRLIGAGQGEMVLPTLLKITLICILCCLPLIAVCAIFPEYVMRIYTDDITLIGAATPTIYVICGAIIFQGIGSVYFEAVSGTGSTNAALYLEFGILLIYIAFIYAMTHLSTHIEHVWLAEYVYGALIAIVSYLFVRFAKWQKRKI